jgi:tetratricopeptide (TPR) repeat protein
VSVKIFVLSIVLCQFIRAQVLDDQRHHELLLQGIRQTLEQEYDSAETTFRTMMKEYPSHPSGYLYLAGMLQAKYSDYGERFNRKQYDSLLTAAEKLSEEMIEKKTTAAWGYLYSGMAEAFRSFTASENGNLPTGFYYGISAGQSLKKCLERDSTFVEAKNILGAYYFWRSKLAWIPFISDKTEEGIGLIKESFHHPYEKHLASHNLMLIFIDEKRYAEAEYYGLLMLKEYPSNRSYLWNMMTVYEQWGKYDSLKSIVERLLQSTMNAQVINRYTEVTCRLKLAQFAIHENDKRTARRECEKILALRKFIGKTKGDLKAKIKQAEELLTGELAEGR